MRLARRPASSRAPPRPPSPPSPAQPTWLGAWMLTASVDCSCRRAMRRMALGTPTVLMVMWRAPAGRVRGGTARAWVVVVCCCCGGGGAAAAVRGGGGVCACRAGWDRPQCQALRAPGAGCWPSRSSPSGATWAHPAQPHLPLNPARQGPPACRGHPPTHPPTHADVLVEYLVGAQHRGQVEQRLAHAHEHNVADALRGRKKRGGRGRRRVRVWCQRAAYGGVLGRRATGR